MSNKSSYIRPVIYTLFLAFSTMLSPGAMAKIPPVAFKGITKHFRNGKEYLSATLGIIALELGLVENIRLYGPYIPAYRPDGTRDYASDTSDDPLWNVVKILFPSSGRLWNRYNGRYQFCRGRHFTSDCGKIIGLCRCYSRGEKPKY